MPGHRSLVAVLVAVLGCHHHSPPATVDPPPVMLPPPVAVDTAHRARRTDTAMTTAERDALVAEARARRAAWQARGITRYRLRVAVGCFCPWPSEPRILEVRDGKAVALYDTTGRPAGPLREPWSPHTVDGLFDYVEQLARRADIVGVRYDPDFGYPSDIRGDLVLGRYDDWFWVRATELRPLR